MAAHVSDRDLGYAQLVHRIFEVAKRRPRITVGIHEAAGTPGPGQTPLDGNATHPSPPGEAAVSKLLTLLEVSVINEFGAEWESKSGKTITIPARSFIRAWFDESEAQLRKDMAVLMMSVIAGKRTADEILEIMGQRCVGQIQARIASGIDPPNAPSTIAAKGSDKPLVNQGIMRASVTYKVEG